MSRRKGEGRIKLLLVLIPLDEPLRVAHVIDDPMTAQRERLALANIASQRPSMMHAYKPRRPAQIINS
jgi:hypothetical protein